jgi:Protein ENHANCED DISEASE RESISTANCE 2, C-terminal
MVGGGGPLSTSATALPPTPLPLLQIRHGGQVHIRGRIRRVWRPRRLELLSDGHLLFYDDNNNNKSNSHHPNHQTQNHPAPLPLQNHLKYTLRVTSARILDVMTIRDLHTGLPRGTYGFLIRGQRIAVDGADTGFDHSPTFEVLPIVEDYHNLHHHHPNVLLKESFVLAEAPTPQPVRDYLCAVDSLEQAQMWVVALQWAAHYLRLQDSEDEHWWKIDYSPSRQPQQPQPWPPVPRQASPQQQQQQLSQQPPHLAVSAIGTGQKKKEAEPAKSTTTTTPPTGTTRPPAVSPPTAQIVVVPTPPPPTTTTKTLVTKATGYTVTPTTGSSRWTSWSFAYEIHVLCLWVGGQTTQPHHTETTTTTTTTTPVEEWTVYKTALELEDICPDAPRLLQRIPRVCSWREILLAPTSLRRRLNQAVSIVDSVLRSFALAADTVGRLATVLAHETTTSTTTTRHHRRNIPTSEMDSYVRTWLQQQQHQSKQSTNRWWWSRALRQLQQEPHYHYWIIMAGGAAAVAMSIPLVVQCCCSRYNIVVPMRVDCLVLSWAGAVYLGYRYGRSQQTQQPPQHPSQNQPQPPQAAVSSYKKQQPTIVRKASSSIHEEAAAGPTTLSNRDEEQHEVVEEEDDDDEESEGEAMEDGSAAMHQYDHYLSSPLPRFPDNGGTSCWSQPSNDIFFVRGANYFKDKIKIPSDKAPLECIGVDFWLTDYPERHIARHPDVLGGTVLEQDTLVVNFLLPFANFVAYFRIPPLNVFPEKLRTVWTKFLKGDQQYRDARLKLLPVVVEGPCTCGLLLFPSIVVSFVVRRISVCPVFTAHSVVFVCLLENRDRQDRRRARKVSRIVGQGDSPAILFPRPRCQYEQGPAGWWSTEAATTRHVRD